MPQVFQWILSKKMKCESAFNSHLETLPPYSTTNNNVVNCILCHGGKIHKMRQKYMICTSKLCGKECQAKYKIEQCIYKGSCKIYKLNEHVFQHDAEAVVEKKIGLSKAIKKVIEEIIVSKDIHTCKRMLIVLTRMKRKGKIDLVPNKIQLSNYLAYRRRKLGDRNNMDDIKKYIMKHLLEDDIDEADIFFSNRSNRSTENNISSRTRSQKSQKN